MKNDMTTRRINMTGIAKRQGRSIPPNTVVRQACDRSGRVLGHFAANHDGTHESMIAAAQRVSDEMFLSLNEVSNINSAILATNETADIPSIADKRVSPHTIRHTTAVHLLNAGVDIDVIRAWLGHVDMRTTNIYTEINLATKRKAIEMCSPKGTVHRKHPAWKKSPNILAWLEAM